MELTKNNHVQFGWNSSKEYWIRFGKANQTLSWREECIKAAEHIVSVNAHPVLCFGGGIDAEVAFHSLIQTGVKFEVAICEFTHQLNMHDIQWAQKICKDYGIKFHSYKLDILEFFEHDLYAYAEKYECASSHAPWHAWLAEQVNGNPIFAGGDLNIFRYEGEKQMRVKFSPHSTVVARCLENQKKQGQPYFFLHTPEMMYSYLTLPSVEAFTNMSMAMRQLSIKWIKPMIYNMNWPEIIYARQKFTGMEKIEGFDQEHRLRLQERYGQKYKPIEYTTGEFKELLGQGN
jgi:hypothetical protein